MRGVRRALGSLRWRLTLTYVALLALLLAALGAFQYVALQRSLASTRVTSLRGDFQEAVQDVLNPVRRPGSALRRRLPGASPSPAPRHLRRSIRPRHVLCSPARPAPRCRRRRWAPWPPSSPSAPR